MKYIIEVKTEIDDGCWLTEYYQKNKGFDIVLTDKKRKAAKMSEEKAETIIIYLEAIMFEPFVRKFRKIEWR